MADERGDGGALKGRLADVYVPALVEGTLDQLSRRLGNRATIDDPLFGRASTLSSIDPLLQRISAHMRSLGATYRHVASATGVDRDVSEGVLVVPGLLGPQDVPIAIVAERRRLREIELRVYYAASVTQPAAARKSRLPLLETETDAAIPPIVAHVLEALRKGAVERVLSAFEEGSRWVDPLGKGHAKRDGAMAAFITDLGGRLELVSVGAADDGRTCLVEAIVTRQRPPKDAEPIALSFERGESGLLRELRFYYEP